MSSASEQYAWAFNDLEQLVRMSHAMPCLIYCSLLEVVSLFAAYLYKPMFQICIFEFNCIKNTHIIFMCVCNLCASFGNF
jgi:hypothetical protein